MITYLGVMVGALLAQLCTDQLPLLVHGTTTDDGYRYASSRLGVAGVWREGASGMGCVMMMYAYAWQTCMYGAAL